MTDVMNVGLRAVADTTGVFAHSFLKTVANDKPNNLITSPLSVQVILAMAAYGASGMTEQQIRSAIHIPSDDALSQSGYKSLIENLNGQKAVDLRLANKIFTSNRGNIKPEYKELTGTKFLSSSQELDFNDRDGSARTINTWCEEQTNNRIKNLISPGSLSGDTALVLVNAVYFKGQWKNKFNPTLTLDRPFHVDETSTTNVSTMFIERNLRFGNLQELDAKFIEIPYKGGEMSMIIILPNAINGLKNVVENLHKVNLDQRLRQVRDREVNLYLPRFMIESTLDLKETLENMGMTDMFGSNANFSGISDISLRVSKVVQKAFIEVNEEGSEAAAATGTVFQYISPSIPRLEVFNVNHPFYYEIRSSTLNVPLFAGFYTAKD